MAKPEKGSTSPQKCSTEELQEAAVQTWAATEGLSLVEYVRAEGPGMSGPMSILAWDVRKFEDIQAENTQLLEIARSEYDQRYPKEEQPRRAAVGRVVYFLTVEGRHPKGKHTCSAGDVFLVFLEQIPLELGCYDPSDYIDRAKSTPSKKHYALERQPARKIFNSRLSGLHADGYCEAAGYTRGGKATSYRLTRKGRYLFDGWPELLGLASGKPAP